MTNSRRAESARGTRRAVFPVMALALSSLLCACATGQEVGAGASPSASRSALTGRSPVLAHVQDFYRNYVAARKDGLPAMAAVVRSHVAAWYYPILEVP